MSTLETRQDKFLIPKMDCPSEFKLIDKGLRLIEGVVAVHPNYIRRDLLVEYYSTQTSAAAIAGRLRELGFPPASSAETSAASRRWMLTAAGATLLAAAMLCWLLDAPVPYVATLSVASTLIAGSPVLIAGIHSLRFRQIDMNVLMSVAAIGALIVGERVEAATTMVLFGTAIWLEQYSLQRANRAVASLMKLAPETVQLIGKSGEFSEPTTVDAATIEQGDRILVRPGDRIAVDGVVLEGQSEVDQAPITGESVPVPKSDGDEVFAGSLNQNGSLTIEATGCILQSRLARIAQLVEQAQQERSPTEQFVDRFARIYTPVVVTFALLVFLVPTMYEFVTNSGPAEDTLIVAREWFHRGLITLVIACPCALVISTPITITCGLRRATQMGALIKGGNFLEVLARTRAVAFDKTGTLTTGRPRVTSVNSLEEGFDKAAILRVAASLESHSSHPLASAILKEAAAGHVDLVEVDSFQAHPGVGVSGRIDGQNYSCQRSTESPPAESPEIPVGSTLVEVKRDDTLVGVIALLDTPREDGERRFAGCEQSESIVSIFSPVIARRRCPNGQATEIAEFQSDLLPEEKIEAVRRAMESSETLVMVGDGINDAPALATASVGIAFGRDASDTTIDSADVTILSPRLDRVVHLVQLGRAAIARLTENITLAIGLKAVVFLLALFGMATMWLAVVADVGASMLVIANGMRLLKFEP